MFKNNTQQVVLLKGDRFPGGTTQVQAQNTKIEGNTGTRSQSTVLVSHVQVNVDGNDVKKDEIFQGIVSASVHRAQSAG